MLRATPEKERLRARSSGEEYLASVAWRDQPAHLRIEHWRACEEQVEDRRLGPRVVVAQGGLDVAPEVVGLTMPIPRCDVLQAMNAAVVAGRHARVAIRLQPRVVRDPEGRGRERLLVAPFEARVARLLCMHKALVPRVLREGGVHVVLEGELAAAAPGVRGERVS